jgi:hypothetical protein
MGQAQVEDDQIDFCEIGSDPRQQLRCALDRDRPVARVFDGGSKPIADEGRIVGDDDRLGRNGSRSHLRRYRNGGA